MNRDDDMSEAQRKEADYIARSVVDAIIRAAQDKETASSVISIWGGEIDKSIGRGIRRAIWYAMVVIAGGVSIKIGLFERIASWFKP